MIPAIVLAGGRSRRMGSPKALLPFAGRPLLAHIADALAAACRPIIVVAPEDAPLPELPDAVRVHDPAERLGPLPALALGLAVVTTSTVFLTACDTPWVSADLVVRLGVARGDADAVVVTDAGGTPNWLVSLIDVAAARRGIAELPGEPSLRAFFARLRVVYVQDAGAARDLDTPEDFTRGR